MPAPPVEPTPALPRESFRAAPLLAQEASYFAASARISRFVLQIHVFAKTLAAFHAFERENSNIHAARHDDVVGRTPGRSEAIEW